MGLGKARAIHLYDETLRMATEDGIISEDEVGILVILAQALGLDEDQRVGAHVRIRIGSSLEEGVEPESGEEEVYRAALVAALHDESVSDDELALLNTLSRAMKLGDEERKAVETMVRSDANEGLEGSRLDRLERFLNRD